VRRGCRTWWGEQREDELCEKKKKRLPCDFVDQARMGGRGRTSGALIDSIELKFFAWRKDAMISFMRL